MAKTDGEAATQKLVSDLYENATAEFEDLKAI
jgi:hypothetical protein